MEEHQRILEDLISNRFPQGINEQSFSSIEIFKELYDRGFITAKDASADKGRAYLEPKITLSGREYLSKLKAPNGIVKRGNEKPWWKSFNSRIALIGLVVSVIGLWISLFKN